MKVAVIGGGNLGTAITMNAARKAEVIVVKRRKELFDVVDNVEVVSSIEEASSADVFIITLKPDVFRANIGKISEVADEKPVISFAAGVKLGEMRSIESPHRAMTNLAIEKKGLVACYPPQTRRHLGFLDAEFIPCSSEKELEAMTSFLGSSPAIISKLVHAFIVAALKEGISYENALKTGIHVFGATAYLYNKYGLESLIQKIATPGGTTAEGLTKIPLAERAFMDALISASKRAEEL
ncbi:pyrroline-5-carboxylate reductase family protein [Archaeoglobus neptunius]|uniref:pyrroline-5-carboxylate reductase family protein n=1 Tax=Archaeoglobus neptunius TaxID=2798580 RepID=UPI001925942C|nr:pyrroline-5-carboxylate reductase dimerization domain-containing protein [Archaeoglobus neptunius]